MASTPVILLLKRTGNASDRPNTGTVQAGEVAMSFGASDPGLYFKDSAGAIRKFGSNHYGTTAPNSSPVGSTGNSVGELWVDSSASTYYLKVWTGGTWQKIGAAFADNAASATVTIASGAIVANSAIVASGSLGAVLASGVVTATGVPVAAIYTGALAGTAQSGTLLYKADDTGSPSGLYVAYAGGWALS
jgi:hypothetical protein